MRAVVYSVNGGSDVLALVERPLIEPSGGEVRVRVLVSGVNPTDIRSRASVQPQQEQIPHQDGAGVVDAVGQGVSRLRVGDRVWVWNAAYKRPTGTAQEFVTLPEGQVEPLPAGVSLDVGAALGIPALTAHHALTSGDGVAAQLRPATLAGRTVLVAGGAGAVGHAAIQLAVWAGATVISTVSGPRKARLARAAGAHEVIDYRLENVRDRVVAAAPSGVDIVVEVDPASNLALDVDVLAPRGVVAIYASRGATGIQVPIRAAMDLNARVQFILTYAASESAKRAAVCAVTAAAAAGALAVGESHGLPLARFVLARTVDAHDAVEAGFVGKVLVDVAQ
ncbi:NADPH:quinone reductase [soil metagenome]